MGSILKKTYKKKSFKEVPKFEHTKKETLNETTYVCMCVRKIAKFSRINKAWFVSSRKILDKGNCFKKPYFITRKNHFHSTNMHTRMLVLNNNFSVISLKLRYNFYWASPIKALGFNYFMIF